MSTFDDEAVIAYFTRTGQIILAALVVGVVLLLGVAIVIKIQPQHNDILTWCAVAAAAVCLPLSVFVPMLVANQYRRRIAEGTWTLQSGPSSSNTGSGPEPPKSDAGKLAYVYWTQLIIGAALNESAAFFAVLAYMITKDPIALGLGLLLVAGLVVRFPTRTRVDRWVERQEEMLVQDRQLF